jgi:4-amino-4-deoxy-L-arabinose transferase-like glycosyltransferase
MVLKKLFTKEIFSDIRFWILLFFVVRLFGITNPPLEVAHNWRQTTVTMVARNFYETDPNIFYPRIDFTGDKSGITGMEFPFYNYLIYLYSLIFGYSHWSGRLINLVVSSVGIFYFFKIAAKYFDRKVAFYSAIVMLSSMWFSYSRKIMPDTFSMSLVMMGFYFATQYLEIDKRKVPHLLLYFVLTLLGVLCKLPSGYILILFLPLFLRKEISLQSKIILSLVSVFIVLPAGLWYFYWVPYLVEKFEWWHFFMGNGMLEGMKEISHRMHDVLSHFYHSAMKYIAFTMFLAGLGFAVYLKNKKLLGIFSLSFLAFLVIMFKAGSTFANHSYYMIPFIPVMALVAGYAIAQLKNSIAMNLIVVGIVIEGILNQQHEFHLKENELAVAALENCLDKFSDRNDRVVINCGNFPTPMYFAHRKGWITFNEKIADSTYMTDIIQRGCKYVVIMKKDFGTEMALKYELMMENEFFAIYKI